MSAPDDRAVQPGLPDKGDDQHPAWPSASLAAIAQRGHSRLAADELTSTDNPSSPVFDPDAVADAHYAQLRERLTSEFNTSQIELIDSAYQLSRRSHAHQIRSSGLPYITHPIAVASLVLDMKLDAVSIICALLHDVVEDTSVTIETIAKEYGQDVAEIVDGLSKLNKTEFRTREQAQAASLRKMFLAMVSDVRVILIKLADRLHNMQTLDALDPLKKRRIARETLEVYAPIANRLGLYSIKEELEDIGFSALHPLRKRLLDDVVNNAEKNNSHVLRQLIARIKSNFNEMGIEARVFGRRKSAYSLYRKKKEKQIPFDSILDIFALRIVVEQVDHCYRALGVVHHLYTPLPRRFKDFIAVPKENGYQSLHTVCASSHNIPIEVQIRTEDMDTQAEAGFAAHWIYKDGEANAPDYRARQWIDGLMELQNNTSDSNDFIDQVKIDLFPREIFVFTPKRRIIQLQSGSTPVDFAFAVHSEVGNKCVSALVDNKLVSLSAELRSGQTVEIQTSNTASPQPAWLNFVVSGKARSAIRHFLRNLDRSQARHFGERLIERSLASYNLALGEVPEKALEMLRAEFRFQSNDELFIDVGLGNHMPSQISERLLGLLNAESSSQPAKTRQQQEIAPLLIEGVEGSVLTLASCCRPVPGDSVEGMMSKGRGVVVHRAQCKNLGRMRRKRKEWVRVAWPIETHGLYQTSIMIGLENRPGALARVSTVISGTGSNIEGIHFDNRGEDHIEIQFLISVRDRQHIAKLVRRLRNVGSVHKVAREI